MQCDSAGSNKGLLGVMECSMEVVRTIDCYMYMYLRYMAYKGVLTRGKERRTTRDDASKQLKVAEHSFQVPMSNSP